MEPPEVISGRGAGPATGGERAQQQHHHTPHILFLDAHDSFSNNVTSLLTTLLGADVHVLAIDAPLTREELVAELRHYDAVVLGPGPGSPNEEADVGHMRTVLRLEGADAVPVLGVCLGFQALAREFGGRVERLGRGSGGGDAVGGLHGMVREIRHAGEDIFEGSAGPFRATLYHSLHANLGQHAVPPAERWAPLPTCPDLVPLAWARSGSGPKSKDADAGEEEDWILMAARHVTRPLWGVQYHPESVCTEAAASGRVLTTWFARAREWNRRNGRQRVDRTASQMASPSAGPAGPARRESYLERIMRIQGGRFGPGERVKLGRSGCRYEHIVVPLPGLVAAPDIVEMLGRQERENIILDSSSARPGQPASQHPQDTRGRFSIVALNVEAAPRFEYRVGEGRVVVRRSGGGDEPDEVVELDPAAGLVDAWAVLSRHLARHRLSASAAPEPEVPFRGGFMGYVTYEMGLEGIGVAVGPRTHRRRPDLCLVWVTESIVLDHVAGVMVVQRLSGGRPMDREESRDWVSRTAGQIQASPVWKRRLCQQQQQQSDGSGQGGPPLLFPQHHPPPQISRPDADAYQARVKECQEYISAGHSYELCLTAQTTIALQLPHTASPSPTAPASLSSSTSSTFSPPPTPPIAAEPPRPWALYRALRARQPVPFGSFIRLGGATLVSSSPERFLSHSADGLCRMHPMKGTVRKAKSGGGITTRPEAEAALQTPKEQAENLMIVDLVRHDLHGVCGAGSVSVPVLMRVEEYPSVWQMVTVVEGRLPGPHVTGIDVLAAALPPGSMTGAPKRRSCEILRAVEGVGAERSLYSGVVGYVDVTGRGDWSVTIRSLFRWEGDEAGKDGGAQEGQEWGEEDKEDDEGKDQGMQEVWRVGAGGAVTALSSSEGEWDEMLTKLAGPLAVFGAAMDG